ncbi:hypothetical protein NC651_037163 [Populus alba x Populus x berolinensis]|nr:hypothetical protein NC651_037163 [Populus alba x Populus x berolinensis]
MESNFPMSSLHNQTSHELSSDEIDCLRYHALSLKLKTSNLIWAELSVYDHLKVNEELESTQHISQESHSTWSVDMEFLEQINGKQKLSGGQPPEVFQKAFEVSAK